ncbi:MAG: hypothetical protein EAZ76_15305 [Nostocales cyanobacterium]|nr:MAG: hypothetical protein EAZ87_23540 [Nostocales cyanobacterium]TAF11076.1 MAG: hypothetical protein EAZ76_15305 [Nostocales cyanobacterium]
MTSFNRSTSRRLKKLNQIPAVWEGDRRPLSLPHQPHSNSQESQGDCIVWVDGSQGIVRGMDIVPASIGPEAVVRTLMRAMEHPQSPAKPGRPQKIVVKDREIQFYLRGVLQDLDIAIEYTPELPLIDELFRSLTDTIDRQVPNLPPQYAEILMKKADEVWEAAPWKFLEEQQILSIEINKWDVGTLYASIMGMLGMEYGILFYRSEDSLKRFRADVLEDEEYSQGLEEAFLKQDCIFLTFDHTDNEDEEDLANFPISEIEPTFGNIHPLEGLRSVLYEEEALVALVATDSLLRFVRDHRHQIYAEDFPAITKRYRIPIPDNEEDIKSVSVTVSTVPELAAELEEMALLDLDDDEDEDELLDFDSIRDDLIPEDSFLNLGVIPWEKLNTIRKQVKFYQGEEIPQAGDGLPVILIQTSRPKAHTIIDTLYGAGGVKAICFNPGANPLDGEQYDLGLLQTENNELFLFGEFVNDDPIHIEAKKKWHQRCQNTNGYCGLIITKGLTGASRGNPNLKDMMALFEVKFLSAQDLNIGTLQLMPQI